MKILMLGHSKVGKTTYMAAMYGALQDGHTYNGFTLSAEDPAVHEQLLHLSRCLQVGRYPDPSDQRSTYDFTLNFHGTPCFPFQWIDYRGGALLERSSSREKERLIEDLREADGVIIFIDSVAACEGRRVMREIGHMTNLLKVAAETSDTTMPITIVFTKSDLLNETAAERVVLPVKSLIEIISGNSSLIGAVVQVACGRSFYNVEQPVLHTIRILIRIIAIVGTERLKQATLIRDHYYDQANTLVGWISDLFADDTNMDKARRAAQEAQECIEVIKPLMDPAEELESYLKSLTTF